MPNYGTGVIATPAAAAGAAYLKTTLTIGGVIYLVWRLVRLI